MTKTSYTKTQRRRDSMRSQEPRSSSSCAACKFLKRRCTPNCQFAPYFRSDEPKKFAKVHKVFGASNVSKILNEVSEDQREDTVSSLVYEAEVRLRDPVYGCIGAIASLQYKMVELQHDLILARARLSTCIDRNRPPMNSSTLEVDYGRSDLAPFAEISDHRQHQSVNGVMENFNQNYSQPFDQFGQFHFP